MNGVSLNSERIWDPLVRLTHWGIAAAVLLNGFVIDEHALAHIWIGYVAVGLLALRLVWGVIGTRAARFASFRPSLSAAMGHLGDLKAGRRRQHASHNPLGSLMVYALWGMLVAVSVTGLAMESAPFPDNGTYTASHREEGGDEQEGEEMLEEVHEATANILLLLAALHVGGVVLESRLSGVNLARQMVTGRRGRPDGAGE
ncbi:MAG: cytochrome b/b6 domain-containing protein [Minwuia sp.]|uniref:cytochrome b/b6 domain-containing protein n=1 Tax=Minwuia sp. TaxID=2493630 RepID=UPI003A87202F